MDEVGELIIKEERRQEETLMMIPSENYASKDVRSALGSVFGNKYAEGYPGRRYYQGNGIADEIENLAIERAKSLFGVPHANVQPYSGSPANTAAIMAMATPGEKIMGLKLSGGGHLTHGHPNITFSGKYYESIQYDVNDEGWIDYDELEKIAKENKPKVIIAGTTAYPRVIEWERFGKIAERTGAYLLADISHIAGLVVGGVHQSPVEFADVIMTTTHKTLRGPRGAILMVTEKGRNKDSELMKKIDRAVFPGVQGGPHMNSIAGIAVALKEANGPEFKEYAKQIVVNAKVLSEELIKSGFTLTTGGTDNHLMVMDLRKNDVDGKSAAVLLEEAGIVLNANAIPHDPNPPGKPSGIRLGTPAVTTRGMKEAEMVLIAGFIRQVLCVQDSVLRTKDEVAELCREFPVPE
jgi:glycine hydroxymethyltransferase